MSTVTRRNRNEAIPELPPLVNGDHMSQVDFHRSYENYPDETKFELIAGTVYMASPLRHSHGRSHVVMAWLLETYAIETLGVEALDNATTILDDENEPQPDLSLRILHTHGGAASLSNDDYLTGPPELIVEIAHSSRAIDLYQKKEAYRKGGVVEYLVLSLQPLQLNWFHFPSGRDLTPDVDGVCRSDVFPGLSINVPALLGQQREQLLAALREGMQSPAHAEFVKRLQAKRSERP
ncbi:Uma2 family endonuclease [soil metagenome]